METLTKQRVIVNTELFKEAVRRVAKGCGMIDALQLTTFIQIEVKNRVMTLTSTDNINYLNININDVDSDDFTMVVDGKLFSALISRITTEGIILEKTENNLLIEGNGKYNLPLIVDTDGSEIRFKDYKFNMDVPEHSISNTELESILTLNKSCKSEMKEVPVIINYYMDNERVVTSDLYRICDNPVKLFDVPTCLPPELVELIPLAADDKGIKIKANDESVMFYSSMGTLFGRKCVEEETKDFPINDFKEVLTTAFSNKCKLNRTMLINALDRICLFIDPLKKNSVQLTFEAEGLRISNLEDNTFEVLRYLTSLENYTEDCTIIVDGTFLKEQITACMKEDVTIRFGKDAGSVQIICDNITQHLGSNELTEE